MKVDRRSFLGLGIGAVAGIAVSPVGIKLTDDSSIWTQNWPWTPVPVDGEVTYENSVCSLCPGSCGIQVRKIDDRPVKIEGLSGYPVNDGGACLHGIAGLQYLYDPARIKSPLIKKGDAFEPISWDDAVSLIAGRLSDVRKSGAPEKLACITDTEHGAVSGLFQRLLEVFGSPNFYTMPSLESYLEVTAASLHAEGKTLAFDLENADFVLSFGAGIIEGWGSPVACFKSNATRKDRNARLFQIEPRLSNTAANADKWIPIKPGTEADLALGLCAVILENSWFDSMATAEFKGGFNRLVAHLQSEYTPARTARITGVKEADIQMLAREFSRAKMPVAVFGKGRGDGAQSLKEMAAVHTLNCLVGNINKKGGVRVIDTPKYLDFPSVSMDATARAGLAEAKLGPYVNQFFEAVNNASKPAVEALLVYNANPCYSLHDPKQVKQAMAKIPFVVSFASFMDETAMAADIILPVHTFLERTEDVPSLAGYTKTVVGLSRPVINPVFDTRNPGDAVLLVAKALDDSIAENFEWNSFDACLKTVAAGIWKNLSRKGYAVVPEDLSFGSEAVNVGFLSANPETVQAQGDDDLILIPVDNMRLLSSSTAASPFAVKTVSDTVLKGRDTVVEINPLSAKGIKDGSYATLTTAMGTARVMVSLNEGIMPGVIGMVEGLGHTFDNKFVSNKGVNVNDLIGPVLESGSGLDAAFGIKAKISKA